MPSFTILADITNALWVHDAGAVTQEFDDERLKTRLVRFAPEHRDDYRAVSIRFPIIRREVRESATADCPAWSSTDIELDVEMATIIKCEGIRSCLLPEIAVHFFRELVVESIGVSDF